MSILFEIWKLSKWPISCANTPTTASYEGAYFNKPVEINNLLLRSKYALGLLSMTIEKFIFLS